MNVGKARTGDLDMGCDGEGELGPLISISALVDVRSPDSVAFRAVDLDQLECRPDGHVGLGSGSLNLEA